MEIVVVVTVPYSTETVWVTLMRRSVLPIALVAIDKGMYAVKLWYKISSSA